MSGEGIIAKLHVWHKDGRADLYEWQISFWRKARGARCQGAIVLPKWHKGFKSRKEARRAGLRLAKRLKLKLEPTHPGART